MADEDGSLHTLWCSAIMGGGPGQERLSRMTGAISRVVRMLDRERGGPRPSDEAAVDIVLHFHGTMISPDFVGIRTGSWIDAKRIQIVQVAVPEGLTDAPELQDFIVRSILAGVDMANDRVARRGLSCRTAKKVAVGLQRWLDDFRGAA
jgi:hypothetical protein